MGSIYRSEHGRRVIRDWCAARLRSWDRPHESRELEVLGAATRVTLAGDGPAMVVVVPGTNFNTATSLPLLGCLAGSFEVAALDVPGQPGLSSGDRDLAGGDIGWYGRWLDAVVDALLPGPGPTRRPVVLLGHSFGGAIVLAGRRPDVRRVVVATGGLCRLRLTPSMLVAFALWTARPSPSSSRRMLAPMLAGGRDPRPELVEWITLAGRHARSSTAPDHVEHPAGRGAVIAVGGREDVFLPPDRLGPAVRGGHPVRARGARVTGPVRVPHPDLTSARRHR